MKPLALILLCALLIGCSSAANTTSDSTDCVGQVLDVVVAVNTNYSGWKDCNVIRYYIFVDCNAALLVFQGAGMVFGELYRKSKESMNRSGGYFPCYRDEYGYFVIIGTYKIYANSNKIGRIP